MVHKKILRFHPAEQKFAFAWALFGLLCLSQNETYFDLHKVHFRNTIWDRNFHLPTWHCLEHLHLAMGAPVLQAAELLLRHLQQFPLQHRPRAEWYLPIWASGTLHPPKRVFCWDPTTPGRLISFAQHLSSLLEVYLWLLTPSCSVLGLCNHEPVLLLLLFESLMFYIQCDRPLRKISPTNPLWNTRASTW